MKSYLSLLRGINVSGQKKIKMVDLKALFESLNLTDVQTYIQSGNVIFCSTLKNPKELAQKIEKKITEIYNFSVPVIVIEISKLKEIILKNPFIKDFDIDTEKLHVTILNSSPNKSLVKNILNFESGDDQFIILEDVVYLNCPNGYGKTKLTNNFFENKLKVTATTRNWKTTKKLLEIANEINCDDRTRNN